MCAPHINFTRRSIRAFNSRRNSRLHTIFHPTRNNRHHHFNRITRFPLLSLLLTYNTPPPRHRMPMTFPRTKNFSQHTSLVPLTIRHKVRRSTMFPTSRLPTALLCNYVMRNRRNTMLSRHLRAMFTQCTFRCIPSLLLRITHHHVRHARQFCLHLPFTFNNVRPMLLLRDANSILASTIRGAITSFPPHLIRQ